MCQIEWLRDCLPPDIRRALKELPGTLDATYKRILLSIGNAKREYARRLFQCLAVSIRPLRVEELADVLAIRLDAREDSELHSEWRPEDARQAVLSACSSLITIVTVDGSPIVQFSHFSIKEFLMSSRLANAGEHLSLYHILPHSAHTVLSRACLSVLLDLGDQVDKSAVERRPFAIYAARYWVDHGKSEGVSSGIQDLMERLFDADRPYFATWVWIYDVDHPWKGSMETVRPTQPEARPIYYAALSGFRSLVESLALTHPGDVDASGGSYKTPLNAACMKGEVDVALALLQNGANINAPDRSGWSPLLSAAMSGRRAILKLLLEHQAQVNFRTTSGMTPLFAAVTCGELDICRLLLKHGADVTSRTSSGWMPLIMASALGHLDIVEHLLVNGADANAQDEVLSAPLHQSSSNGHLKIVQSLVRHGATLDKTDIKQRTPLHSASRVGDLEISRFLIEQGANTMLKDSSGNTPLHNASRRGLLDLMKILLEGGVDINTPNADDNTPLHFASGNGNLEVARFLIKHGANTICCDKRDRTPLHQAARDGHLNIVRLLLDHGVGVQARTAEHETPLTGVRRRTCRGFTLSDRASSRCEFRQRRGVVIAALGIKTWTCQSRAALT